MAVGEPVSNWIKYLSIGHSIPPWNSPPSDLTSLELTMSESQPVGTFVGEFNATDPDVLESINSIQAQVERITVGGSIAAGDIFVLNLNELTYLHELESTHAITYTATQEDENFALEVDQDGIPNSGDEYYDQTPVHRAVRDHLMHTINQQVNFVSATASGDDSILITSSVKAILSNYLEFHPAVPLDRLLNQVILPFQSPTK